MLDWARAHAMFLNIELKTAAARRDPVGGVVAELLERTPDTGAPLVVSSFHPLVLLEFHRVLPRVPTGFNTWTVNEPEQARGLATLGVNAIISDCPGKIARPHAHLRSGPTGHFLSLSSREQ